MPNKQANSSLEALKPSILAKMTLRELNEHLTLMTGERARSRDEAIQRITSARRMVARAQAASDGTLRSYAEQLLHKPLTYSEVLTEVKAQFPDCRTSRSSLRWYASQMRKRGEEVPERPLDI